MYDKKSQVYVVNGDSVMIVVDRPQSLSLTEPVPYGDVVKDKEQKVKKLRSVVSLLSACRGHLLTISKLLWLWLEIFDRGDTGQGACKHQEKVMNFMRSLDWKVENFRGLPDE